MANIPLLERAVGTFPGQIFRDKKQHNWGFYTVLGWLDEAYHQSTGTRHCPIDYPTNQMRRCIADVLHLEDVNNTTGWLRRRSKCLEELEKILEREEAQEIIDNYGDQVGTAFLEKAKTEKKRGKGSSRGRF